MQKLRFMNGCFFSNIHVGCCIFSQFSEAAGTDAAAILIFQSSFGKIV